MTKMTAFDAKTRFGELLDRVAKGEEIIITRHEKPVARMVPEGRRSREQVGDAVDALLRLRSRIADRAKGRAALTYDEVKSAIGEGRQ